MEKNKIKDKITIINGIKYYGDPYDFTKNKHGPTSYRIKKCELKDCDNCKFAIGKTKGNRCK